MQPTKSGKFRNQTPLSMCKINLRALRAIHVFLNAIDAFEEYQKIRSFTLIICIIFSFNTQDLPEKNLVSWSLLLKYC